MDREQKRNEVAQLKGTFSTATSAVVRPTATCACNRSCWMPAPEAYRVSATARKSRNRSLVSAVIPIARSR